MTNITFDLGGIGSGVKTDNFLADLVRNKDEKEKVKVPLPQVGEVKLDIPPFFAQKDAKGKWRLVNPLTLVRNLATRKGKKSIAITRKNVEDASVEEGGGTPAPPLSVFSQRDQNRIIKYFKGVKSGSAGEYQTKNKQRGFPATLYKNAEKAGLTRDDNTKTYAKNKTKAKATYIPKPPKSPRRGRQVVLRENYIDQLIQQFREGRDTPPRVDTPPPSPPQSPRQASPAEDKKEEVNRLFEELAERSKNAFSKEGEKKFKADYNIANALRKALPEEDKEQSRENRNKVVIKFKSFSAETAPPPPPEPEKNELGLTQKELDSAEEVSKEKDFYKRATTFCNQQIESLERDYKTTKIALLRYDYTPEEEKDNEQFMETKRDKIKELKETLVKLEKGKEEGTPLWEVDNYLFQLAFKTSVPSKTSDYDKVFKVWKAVYDRNERENAKAKGKGLAGSSSEHSDSSSEGEDEPHDPDGGALRLGGKKGMRKILYQPDDGELNECSMGMTPETDGMEAGSLFSMVKDFISPAKNTAPLEQTLTNKELQDLLMKSYDGQLSDYGDYKVDRDLSNPISQVYYNEAKRQPLVVHRGSAEAGDWKENAEYGLFNIKSGTHFKTAENTQRRAEAKYGTENLTTIGHSKGAIHAEDFGQRGKQIITLNKPVSPYDLISKRVPENQIDIKTSGDPVSSLRGLQFGNQARVLSSKSSNPLAEHSVNVLEGTGIRDNIKTLFEYMRGRPIRRHQIAVDTTPLLQRQNIPQPPSRQPTSQDDSWKKSISEGFRQLEANKFVAGEDGYYDNENTGRVAMLKAEKAQRLAIEEERIWREVRRELSRLRIEEMREQERERIETGKMGREDPNAGTGLAKRTTKIVRFYQN